MPSKKSKHEENKFYSDINKETAQYQDNIEETSRLTDALLKQGCRNPKAMKFDVETNQFEAEDAVCEGGRKYDIYLDKNFRIVSMKPD